ncbi:MAG: FAD-dependent oxidoreductase [Clostridia bacterium]|nr:FAD-dependent oxidoreductase [Clostridia bacterium]
MKSIWSDFSMPHFERLEKDIKTDVLIIGGGIAGLLIAHELKKRGVDCVIAEANTICSGITKNTTAKITSQHGLIYSKLINDAGVEAAKLYLDANEKAISKYKRLCKSIDCDFEETDSYVFTLADKSILENEMRALSFLGSNAEFEKQPTLPFETAGAVKFKNQAQFHPLKFAAAIAKDLKIYESTEVTDILGHTAKTLHGKITADKIVVATHFPFINRHGLYFIKMYQARSYVIAIKNAHINGMYVDGNDSGLSLRSYGDFLLIGSGGHRTGKQNDGWSYAQDIANRHYPQAEVAFKWANQDCITLDELPYIGQYSKSTPNMYVATGFNKWGMTSAMVAADIIADAICERKNDYSDLYSPSRSILKKQLAINTFETATNLLRLSKPRCPHLGCALKWNKKERSWDCPCHGSRFSESGKVIDNPAMKGLEKH